MDAESAQRLVCVFMSLKRRVRAARPKTTSLYNIHIVKFRYNAGARLYVCALYHIGNRIYTVMTVFLSSPRVIGRFG